MTPKNNQSNPGNPQKSALLVIDVQRGLFVRDLPVYKADRLLSNVHDLVDRAHAASVPVIYIQHCGEKSLVKGTNNWELHPDLHPEHGDWHIEKENSNAFQDTELAQKLASDGIGSVVAVGLVTHGCVKNTCLGGLEEGFQVVLAGDAHSNFSKDAARLITKWNKSLAEKGVQVKATAEIHF